MTSDKLQTPMSGLMKLLSWLATDIRSAFVGAIAGAIISIGWQSYQDSLKSKFAILGANNGIANAAQLFDETNKEGEMKLTFNPPALNRTRVCEYSAYRGHTYWDMAFEFLQHYSDCFMLTQKSAREFIITPNNFSGVLTLDGQGNYSCKCAN